MAKSAIHSTDLNPYDCYCRLGYSLTALPNNRTCPALARC